MLKRRSQGGREREEEEGREPLKSQVVLLQTAHSWANAGVLLGARMHRERVAFETIKVSG